MCEPPKGREAEHGQLWVKEALGDLRQAYPKPPGISLTPEAPHVPLNDPHIQLMNGLGKAEMAGYLKLLI